MSLSRNPCIQLLYGFLMSGGTAIYSFKVIPYFDKMNTFSIVTYILIAINVMLFWVCCTHDPGVIKVTNHTEYMNDYNPDGVYYTTQECSTCKFIKPARSKHCCKYINCWYVLNYYLPVVSLKHQVQARLLLIIWHYLKLHTGAKRVCGRCGGLDASMLV